MIDLFDTPPQKPSAAPCSGASQHRSSVVGMEGIVVHEAQYNSAGSGTAATGIEVEASDSTGTRASAGSTNGTSTTNAGGGGGSDDEGMNVTNGDLSDHDHSHNNNSDNHRSSYSYDQSSSTGHYDDCLVKSYNYLGQTSGFQCPGVGIGPQIACVPPNWIELASRVFHGDQQELASDGKLTEGQMKDFYNYSIGVGHEGFDGRLLSETFLSTGRINHAIQIMAYHSDYLEVFLRAHHFLLRGDGPLPYTFRHYIAIMAAARFQCGYLMELQKREFLLQGGDPKWLSGLEAAPQKLTSLYHINKMMAHRPWVLKKEDFLFLTKKAGWSLSEVVQAVVLLAHFHSLSSFIHGCGITPEIDFDKGHSYLDPITFNVISSSSNLMIGSGTTSPSTTLSSPGHQSLDGQLLGAMSGSSGLDSSSSPAPSPTTGSVNIGGSGSDGSGNKAINKTDMASNSPVCGSPITNHLMHHPNKSPNPGLLRPATHHMNSQPSTPNTGTGVGIMSPPPLASSPPKKATSEVETIMATMKNLSETIPIEDPEERKKRFETVASCDDSHEKENRMNLCSNLPNALPPDVSPFLNDPEFTYEDFAKRGQLSELHTFRIQDYSWEEHGFSLVNRLYADVGGYLDDKFKVAQNMTYYTMGDRAHVDTTKFRIAVWNYIQCLYGIRHDDYDYGEVNQLLERPLKSYIKTVCCYPAKVTQADYDNVMREFKHSEKVHVNLLIMEAKIQAELLYGLRTIMRFIL